MHRSKPSFAMPGAHRALRRRRWPVVAGGLIAVVVIVVALAIVQLLRPAPQPTAAATVPSTVGVPAGSWSLPFLAGVQQVVTVSGLGELGSTGSPTQTPIASVTKLMSALVILADHPLGTGQQGPAITVTPGDVATYEQEKAAGDSVVAVVAGEKLSELQALQAALVPSADNVIELLARWDAGSIPAFVAKMNAEAQHLGLSHTRYADASGVDPGSASTATDQVRVAELAMANPVLAGIVGSAQVTLPVAGVQYNVDADLGTDGIVGVKTGWVPQGGASFVFAARTSVAGHAETVIGAILGDQATPALPSALSQAEKLVRSTDAGLVFQHVVSSGEQVALISSGRGSTVPVDAGGAISLVAWRGAQIALSVQLEPRLPSVLAAGERVGTLVASLGSQRERVPLLAAGSLAAPSIGWRLTRL